MPLEFPKLRIEQKPGAFQCPRRQNHDLSLDMHFTLRMAIDKMDTISQSGVLVYGYLAYDGVLANSNLPVASASGRSRLIELARPSLPSALRHFET